MLLKNFLKNRLIFIQCGRNSFSLSFPYIRPVIKLALVQVYDSSLSKLCFVHLIFLVVFSVSVACWAVWGFFTSGRIGLLYHRIDSEWKLIFSLR